MQKEISLILLDRVKEAPYLDRVSGLVQTFERIIEGDNGRGVTKRIPVTSFATFQDCADKPQPQMDMIPNNHYKSLLYFEDNGISAPNPSRYGFDYTSRLRLVCWLNTRLVAGATNMLLSAQVINDLVARLCPPSPFNVSPFVRIKVNVSGIPAQDKNIFSRYDYSERETQYLMPPFEFFAIDLNVGYTVLKDCLPPIESSISDPCSILQDIFPCQNWEPQNFAVWGIDKPNYYTKAEINALLGSSVDFTRIIENEIPIGAVNGSNATFTTAFEFVPETVAVTINGLEQTPAVHFTTSGTQTIIFTDSPQTDDEILVDYIKP